MADDKQAQSDNPSGIVGAIKGPYGVLGAVSVALEGILTVWLVHAGDSQERIAVGFFMTLILLAIIGAVVFINSQSAARPSALQRAQTLDSAPVSPEEIKSIPVATSGPPAGPPGAPPAATDAAPVEASDFIAAPDGAYIIGRPPPGWSTRVMTMSGVIQEKYGSKITDGMPAWLGGSVLEFQYGDSLSFTPLVGKTRCNGRPYPLLLSEPFKRQLQITTMPHRQPPFFIERSLYDNFVLMVTQQVQMQSASVTSMALGKLPKTNRDTLVAGQAQRLENIMLNGRDVAAVDVEVKFTAIRGDLVDYFFVVTNFREAGASTAAADQMDKDVAQLFNTFRPTSVADLPAQRAAAIAKADADFAANEAAINTAMFDSQFGVARAQVSELNYHTLDGLKRAVETLRPFRTLAKSLPDKAAQSAPLWQAMDAAEAGETAEFRRVLDEEFNPRPINPPPAPLSYAAPVQLAKAGWA